MNCPKITIITVSFNSRKTIEETILSVINQTYQNIEYIVVDGLSTDGTLDIIQKYKDKISKIISEKDSGIYFAMNKGIQSAQGDVIGFLNSDDIFSSCNIVEKIASKFSNDNIGLIYGDLLYVQRYNIKKIIRYWKSSQYQMNSISRGWMPAHPTFYAKRSMFCKHGSFDTSYNISADYDIMVRFLKTLKTYEICYIPEVLILMRVGGKSNRSIFAIISANLEACKILKRNGYKFSFLSVILKPMRKIFQFYKFKDSF